jgi:hypothetical protein
MGNPCTRQVHRFQIVWCILQIKFIRYVAVVVVCFFFGSQYVHWVMLCFLSHSPNPIPYHSLQEDRITPSEECELGNLTQEAIRLQNLFDKLCDKLGREPKDEEWCAAAGKINLEAIQQAMDEGLQAKNKLVTSNLRMVQGVVNTYIRNGLGGQYNAGDMMQEGVMVSLWPRWRHVYEFVDLLGTIPCSHSSGILFVRVGAYSSR